jgi:hypothetical protein
MGTLAQDVAEETYRARAGFQALLAAADALGPLEPTIVDTLVE